MMLTAADSHMQAAKTRFCFVRMAITHVAFPNTYGYNICFFLYYQLFIWLK